MSAQRRKSLAMVAGVVALVVVAALTAILMFDINTFKSDIEVAASDATGLKVTIAGRMGLSFFPFGISAHDVHVASRGSEIISVKTLKLGAELMPLLQKRLKVSRCELVKPVITLVKGADGSYNFAGSEKKSPQGEPGAGFRVKDLTLSKGVLVYLDQKTGDKTEVREFNLVVKDLMVAGTPGGIARNMAFTGDLECKEVRKKDLSIGNVKGALRAGKGVFHLTPLTMDIFGGKGAGAFTLDTSAADAAYTLDLKVSQLDFANLQASFGSKKTISGTGEMHVSLTMKKRGHGRLMGSAAGTFSLRGDDLVINTMDLDKVLSAYETSQGFNLVDLGAFFIAGPLSTVALKGYRYGDVYTRTQGGQGAITHFNSHWKIMSGVAEATDCALATRHNRVALKGRLDLVNERYDGVIVALLDDKGCAKFRQSISGPFSKPKIGVVSVAEFIAGPLANLFRQAKRFAQGGTCEVFYNGSVPHPRP
jgi:AsmA protein